MEPKDLDLLRRIIMETASALQNEPPVTIDDWCEMHDELVRATKIIGEEIERLA